MAVLLLLQYRHGPIHTTSTSFQALPSRNPEQRSNLLDRTYDQQVPQSRHQLLHQRRYRESSSRHGDIKSPQIDQIQQYLTTHESSQPTGTQTSAPLPCRFSSIRNKSNANNKPGSVDTPNPVSTSKNATGVLPPTPSSGPSASSSRASSVVFWERVSIRHPPNKQRKAHNTTLTTLSSPQTSP